MVQWYTRGLVDLLERMKPAEVVEETGQTTSGDPVFTSDTNPSNLKPGMTISSPQFPEGTKVVSVVGAAVTMDANATATSLTAEVTGVLPSGILSPITVHPLTVLPPLDPDTDFDQLTVATVPGVLAQELTLGDPQLSLPDGVLIAAQCVEWRPSSDPVTPETIVAVAYTLEGQPDPILIASEALPAPSTLATTDDALTVVPVLNAPFASDVQGLVQLG